MSLRRHPPTRGPSVHLRRLPRPHVSPIAESRDRDATTPLSKIVGCSTPQSGSPSSVPVFPLLTLSPAPFRLTTFPDPHHRRFHALPDSTDRPPPTRMVVPAPVRSRSPSMRSPNPIPRCISPSRVAAAPLMRSLQDQHRLRSIRSRRPRRPKREKVQPSSKPSIDCVVVRGSGVGVLRRSHQHHQLRARQGGGGGGSGFGGGRVRHIRQMRQMRRGKPKHAATEVEVGSSVVVLKQQQLLQPQQANLNVKKMISSSLSADHMRLVHRIPPHAEPMKIGGTKGGCSVVVGSRMPHHHQKMKMRRVLARKKKVGRSRLDPHHSGRSLAGGGRSLVVREAVPQLGLGVAMSCSSYSKTISMHAQPSEDESRPTLTDLSFDTLSHVLSYLRTWREIFHVMAVCAQVRDFFTGMNDYHLAATKDLPTFVLKVEPNSLTPTRDLRYVGDAMCRVSAGCSMERLGKVLSRLPNVSLLELRMNQVPRSSGMYAAGAGMGIGGLLKTLGGLKTRIRVLRVTDSWFLCSKCENQRNADLVRILMQMTSLEELIMGRDLFEKRPVAVEWKVRRMVGTMKTFPKLRFLHLGGRFVFSREDFVGLLATFPRLRGVVLGADVPTLFSEPLECPPHSGLKTLWVKMKGNIGPNGFASILKTFPTIKALALPDARIEWPTLELGFEYRSNFVRRLQVWNNRLELRGLVSILRSFPNLHVLDVHNNSISIADGLAVAQLKSLSPETYAITALVIGHNEITFEGLSVLIGLFPNLIRLDCEDCDVFGGDLVVPPRNKIQELRLGPSERLWNQCVLSHATMQMFFSSRMRKLRLLYIRGYPFFGWENPLKDGILARKLGGGRCPIRSLEFTISLTWDGFVVVLNSLTNLSSCWVSRGCLVRNPDSAKRLKPHRNLRDLVLSHNDIRSQSFWDILECMVNLRRLDADGCNLRESDLLFAARSARASLGAPWTNSSLTLLDVGENPKLRFQGFRLVLQTCSSLRRVIASDCGIQIPPRMPHLVRHFGIRVLDLSSNWQLYRVGVIESLCEFYFPNLRRCNVSNCGWSHDVFFGSVGGSEKSKTEWICEDIA